MKSSAVIILGMHRSGTSCLAGALEEAGLNLGEVDRKKHTNPKGNRENLDIMHLNNAVLEENGASWNMPPEAECAWSPENCVQRDALIASYGPDTIWGFKDPRTVLVFDGWRDALPEAQLIATFRHPTAVAQSLNTRNGFPMEDGIALWTAYNTRLLRIIEAGKVPLVCFDWSTERYNSAVRQIAGLLGLKNVSGTSGFFENDLRKSKVQTDTDLPEAAHRLYQQLTTYALPASTVGD